MSATTSPIIQNFLNKTPVSNQSFNDFVTKQVGLRKPNVYKKPTDQEAKDVRALCRTLVEFENCAFATKVDQNKINSLTRRINILMTRLQIKIVRPVESGLDKDWLIFMPIVKDDTTPLKMAAALVYRFGKVIDKEKTDQNYTVSNLAVVSEHTGQDGADLLAANLFLKNKAKFALFNFFKPHTVLNKDYDSETGGRRNQYFTDPAHSDTTIFLPILKELLRVQFREMPTLIMHGMAAPEGEYYQALIGNCFGKFRQDGWRSFANMLGISFGIEDYYVKKETHTSPVISICSSIPNSVLKDKKTIPMSPTKPRLADGALQWPGTTITTNVTGHIGYYAENPLSGKIANDYTLPSDRMMHVETTAFIRSNAENRDRFAKVVQRALDMYKTYDPAIHDPHKLATKFATVANNMKQYPALFDPTFIANYKKNNKATYDKDTQAYKTKFAANKQLPPPMQAASVASSDKPQALIFSQKVITNPEVNDNNPSIIKKVTLTKK